MTSVSNANNPAVLLDFENDIDNNIINTNDSHNSNTNNNNYYDNNNYDNNNYDNPLQDQLGELPNDTNNINPQDKCYPIGSQVSHNVPAHFHTPCPIPPSYSHQNQRCHGRVVIRTLSD